MNDCLQNQMTAAQNHSPKRLKVHAVGPVDGVKKYIMTVKISCKILLPVLLLPAGACNLFACSVPVFRYALQRWEADTYTAVVLHRGPLTEEQAELTGRLEQPAGGQNAPLNWRVQVMDVTGKRAALQNRLGIPLPKQLPALLVWFPGAFTKTAPFWQSALDDESVTACLQSPARRRLARRLMDGESAVWLFVPSGQEATDQRALRRLQTELQRLEEKINTSMTPTVDPVRGDTLRASFSVLPVPVDDPDEKFFRTMLRKSIPQQLQDGAVVFPVTGRGRSLEFFAGTDINEENIRGIVSFVTGPCGCEIKAQNPGVDLLMAANWDAAVFSEYYEPLPVLTGVAPGTARKQAGTAVELVDLRRPAEKRTNVITVVLVVMIVLLVLSGAGGFFLVRKSKRARS